MKWLMYTKLGRFEEKQKRLGKWKKWFAWYPVEISSSNDHRQKEMAWLQYVEKRKRVIPGTDYFWWRSEYKEIEDSYENKE